MEKQLKETLPAELAKIVADALQGRVFSACSIGYFTYENNRFLRDIHNYGYTEADGKGNKVDHTTVYDLASLTKPLVTVPAIMAMVSGGRVRLEDELGLFWSGLRRDVASISLKMLLSHSSGLPAHRPYFTLLGKYPEKERKEEIVRLIGSEKLLFRPGSGILYSDLGFILLGILIEKLTGISLADFWTVEIAQPIGLQAELFFPVYESFNLGCAAYAATGTCSWSKKKLCGIVHDDNCRMLGGVAGHAGLFGTISGLMSFIENVLLQYRGITSHPTYGRDILKEFLTRRPGSPWTYGFDTPTVGASSSGRFFSEKTIGHLGFTGTSFWLDLTKGAAVVLLTNRVLMGNDPMPIRKLRPSIHDTIMKYLMEATRLNKLDQPG